MESYKTLINYAQIDPKANEYLKEVMKDNISKMVKFTTESGMVASAAIDDTHNNTSTIKDTVPLVMGVPLRIVSSRYTKEEKIQPVREQGRNGEEKKRTKENIMRSLLGIVGKFSCKPTNALGYKYKNTLV
jgi:hypothetical protein